MMWEFIGATLAVVLFRLVRPDEFGRERTMVAELTSEFLGQPCDAHRPGSLEIRDTGHMCRPEV